MSARPSEAPASEGAVLVVDPDPTTAERLRPVVSKAGLAARLDAAPSLAAGLDALAAGRYALVVLALAATDREDLGCIDRIRAIDPEVPIVLAAESADASVARAALQKGAQDCAPRDDLLGRSAERILGHAIERQRIMLELHEARAREQYLATHDPLTGLPNRALFYDRLAQALAAASRYGKTIAILFLDLDGFKAVNDELGHEGGDHVLAEVARRLAGAVRKSDTVARIGGDEFTVVLGELGQPEDAARVAQGLLEALAEPLGAGGREFRIRASVGIAIHPSDGDRADTLVRNADAAMYAAKKQGGDRVAFYDRQMHRGAKG